MLGTRVIDGAVPVAMEAALPGNNPMSRATEEQIAAWEDMRLNVLPRAGAYSDVLDALIAERRECESRPKIQPHWSVSYMGNDPEWLAWGCNVRDETGHAGHISHGHASHGNSFYCSCGESLPGCFSVVIPDDDWTPPDSCPLCPAPISGGTTP